MNDAVPVVQILRAKGLIEAVLVPKRVQVGGQSAFAEHLLNRIAGNDVDQQKNQRNDQPDHGKREKQTRKEQPHCRSFTINQRRA